MTLLNTSIHRWKATYSSLKGSHSLLSPSKYHWVNYSDEKLISFFQNAEAKSLGTRIHKLAELCIELKQRLPNTDNAVNRFVNDAIGYRMQTEQMLYFSPNCFGQADAISFHDGILRIHDLKTGNSSGSIKQLMIYAAIFSLDYGVDPGDHTTVLRIYHGDEVLEYLPEPAEIREIAEKIIYFDKLIEEFRLRGVL